MWIPSLPRSAAVNRLFAHVPAERLAHRHHHLAIGHSDPGGVDERGHQFALARLECLTRLTDRFEGFVDGVLIARCLEGVKMLATSRARATRSTWSARPKLCNTLAVDTPVSGWRSL